MEGFSDLKSFKKFLAYPNLIIITDEKLQYIL